jgi:predicted nucleic acid-binding protein
MLSPGERLVVDASVAIKWVVSETGNERAITLLDYNLVVPDLLFAECANVLWRKLRRREISAEEADIAAQALEQADLTVVSTRGYVTRAVTIASELDHPAYDSIYLALAEALDLRLVTADDSFVRKVGQGRAAFRDLLLPLSDIAPTGQPGYSA